MRSGRHWRPRLSSSCETFCAGAAAGISFAPPRCVQRASADGPLRLLASVCNSLALRSVQARRRAGRGRSAEACPPLRYGCPVLLGFGSHRVTHFTRYARCVRTDAVSQRTKRVSTRADPKPAVLGGAYALRPRPTRRLAGGDRSWGRVFGKPRASSPRLGARQNVNFADLQRPLWAASGQREGCRLHVGPLKSVNPMAPRAASPH
jgi:hypothetical protein